MNRAIICIGSNTVNAIQIVHHAANVLAKLAAGDAKCSEIYQCPSHNGLGNDYYNMVIEIFAKYDYQEIIDISKSLEKEAGRTSLSKITGEMPLDIDLVIWNNRVMRPYDFSRPHFQLGYSQL